MRSSINVSRRPVLSNRLCLILGIVDSEHPYNMQYFNFGAWISRHRVTAYILAPLAVSALMMGMYFSGSVPLQQLVAPTIEGMSSFTWREFGVLEMLQNALLLYIVILLIRSAFAADKAFLSAVFVLLAMGFLFVLLEEIDYGQHFVEYLSGTNESLDPEGWDRNVHNRTTAEGVQYGSYMKTVATVTLISGFLVAPFLLGKSRFRVIRLFTPSRWAAATVLLIALLSRVAHLLDDSGLAVINGVPGNLEYNISEFRELNMYYLFLVYFAELHNRLRGQKPLPAGKTPEHK